ncbi:MAG: glutamate racemase [Pseudomonadota bacterium]|jgi:glutamate racemase
MIIGVFDSGVGGMTVLSELRKRFPGVRFLYLGDTANLPYGTKSPAQIRRLATDCAAQLRDRGVSVLVVACNTASSLALNEIRAVCGSSIPVLGVVEPGVSSAIAAHQRLAGKLSGQIDPVLVLATRATIKSGVYGEFLRKSGLMVFEQACPLLVPLIEEGWTEHPVMEQVVEEYVGDYRRRFARGVALLGCTHYPWIQRAFERALPGWVVVNSAQAIADQLEPMVAMPEARQPTSVEWIFTDPEAIPAFVLPLP